MRRLSAVILVAALVPGALAARDTRTVEQVLAGRTAGPPRSCVSEPQIDDTQIFGSGAILYRMKSGPDYLNTPPGCHGVLRPNSAMSSRVPSTSLCRGDIIQVFDPVSHIDYGSCGLGDFIPYARVKKP
jgi:hypothetical protein